MTALGHCFQILDSFFAGLANFVENLMEAGDRPPKTHTATPMWLTAYNLRGLVSFSEVSLGSHTKRSF